MAQFQNKKTGETRFVDDSPKTAKIMLAKGWRRVIEEPQAAAESTLEAPKPAKSKAKAEPKD